MALIDQLAEELSADVMAAMEELGDDRFHEEVSKVLLAASPTVQEHGGGGCIWKRHWRPNGPPK
jgi:hypothetical protein